MQWMSDPLFARPSFNLHILNGLKLKKKVGDVSLFGNNTTLSSIWYFQLLLCNR